MNGAEAVVRTLVGSDVDVCFANPGTSEMHFVAALDKVGGMRCILGLSESVVTGAADGYARMTGKPAVAVMHLGSGLSNGSAGLHNAHVCRTPVVALVGDLATYHKTGDSGATSDIESIAKGVSDWIRTSKTSRDASGDTAAAVQAARTGQIATLILPGDVSWNDGAEPAPALAPLAPPPVDMDAVRDTAKALRIGEKSVIVLAGKGQTHAGMVAAQRIAVATGAQLRTLASVPRMERGRGRVPVTRIPYVIDPALKMLEGTQHVILAGAKRPSPFFAYPGKPTELAPAGSLTHVLAHPGQDELAALEALADELGAPREVEIPVSPVLPEKMRGAFEPEAFAMTLGALLPENAIVYDDAVSSGRPLFDMTFNAAPHDWLMNCGGAIGGGLPCSAGAAIAAPDRKVVCLQADGAGMYNVQSLWTHAHEKLDIVTVILANRKYKILFNELLAVGAKPGAASEALFNITEPTLDWLKIAAGMGVEGVRVDSLETFADAFSAACKRRGPFLIEFLI